MHRYSPHAPAGLPTRRALVLYSAVAAVLALALFNQAVLAIPIIHLKDPNLPDGSGNAPTQASPARTPDAQRIDQETPTTALHSQTKPEEGKLRLGLTELLNEYQGFKEAVAFGRVAPGPFQTQQTLARLLDDRVLIDSVASTEPGLLKPALEALGAEVTGVAGSMVSALIPLEQLAALQRLDGLAFAMPAVALTWTGAVTSQGDQAQRSNLARGQFEVDGSGSTIGILSDSIACLGGGGGYAADIDSGDLPVDVEILLDFDGAVCTDEGRAMAQIVHDVAPGADLAFASAFYGQAAFAQAIQDLADPLNGAGANLIVDDVFYFAEPMFQDGVIAQAVDSVVAEGVTYFSSAGNSGRQAYASSFRDSGLTGVFGRPLHDFDPGPGIDTRLNLQQSADTTYIFQWSDPYFSVSGAPGAASDLDICFYSPPEAANPFACAAANNTGGDPIEIRSITGSGQLAISIEKWSGPAPQQIKLLMIGNTSFLDPYDGIRAGTIAGHANAAGANAVGASAYFRTPAFGVSPPVLNGFSSAGNTPILFQTNGAPVSLLRQKPEFTAPDGGNNTFFGVDVEPDGWPNFFGTSAAAPHATGVAALMRQSNPTMTANGLRLILKQTAVDMLERYASGTSGTRLPIGAGFDNDSGAGLIDAQGALAALRGDATPVTGAIIATFLGLETWPEADVNEDGAVDVRDLLFMIGQVIGE